MKLYKRSDFISLPAGSIYSRVNKDYGELMHGLFCKISGEESVVDFIEQDLIAEPGFPNKIISGQDAVEYQLKLRDSFQEFETDLDCAGRDGMFDNDDVFVVWDSKDISKLIDYLQTVLISANRK